MKKLHEITDSQCQEICQLVNEHFIKTLSIHNSVLLEDDILEIQILTVPDHKNNVKVLLIREDGLIDLFTYNTNMLNKITHIPVNAMLITDYLKLQGYQFKTSL